MSSFCSNWIPSTVLEVTLSWGFEPITFRTIAKGNEHFLLIFILIMYYLLIINSFLDLNSMQLSEASSYGIVQNLDQDNFFIRLRRTWCSVRNYFRERRNILFWFVLWNDLDEYSWLLNNIGWTSWVCLYADFFSVNVLENIWRFP